MTNENKSIPLYTTMEQLLHQDDFIVELALKLERLNLIVGEFMNDYFSPDPDELMGKRARIHMAINYEGYRVKAGIMSDYVHMIGALIKAEAALQQRDWEIVKNNA